jgi:hypothetical protein
MEWYLDARTYTLYHHIEGVWTCHEAKKFGRLRFQVDAHACEEAHACDEPNQYWHVVDLYE